MTPEKWGTSVDIPRATATPETYIYRVDTATGRVIASVKTPFPEDFEPARDGGLWIAPLRDARVLYVAPQ